MLKKNFIPIFCFSLFTFSLHSQVENNSIPPDLYKNLPFDMEEIKKPVFPDHQVSITDFGAVGDGLTLNTEAFSKAIRSLAGQGGGTVIIPNGIWYTGPIVLEDNIHLYTEEGALVVFSENFDDYPIVSTVFEGLDTKRCQSPLSAINATNIAITGKGVFNGSGDAWRPVKKEKMTGSQWKKLVSSGGVLNEKKDMWFPSEKSLKGDQGANMNVPNATTDEEFLAVKDFLRPVMISFRNCKNVLLEGVTFENSPSWNIHPFVCENIILQDVTVRNP